MVLVPCIPTPQQQPPGSYRFGLKATIFDCGNYREVRPRRARAGLWREDKPEHHRPQINGVGSLHVRKRGPARRTWVLGRR